MQSHAKNEFLKFGFYIKPIQIHPSTMEMCYAKKPKQEIEIETILSHLKLETVDETQTAFAKNGIYISETTAFKWRELAKENPNPNAFEFLHDKDECTDENPKHDATEVKPKCLGRLASMFCNMFRSWKRTER
jgi:hypothetical protein